MTIRDLIGAESTRRIKGSCSQQAHRSEAFNPYNTLGNAVRSKPRLFERYRLAFSILYNLLRSLSTGWLLPIFH